MWKILTNKWLLLGLMALTWGSSFILIKRSLEIFTPVQIGAFRVGMSGLILALWGIPALLKMKKSELFWLSLAGLCGNFVPMFIFPIAQTRVSSSLAGMINALEPIFVLVLGFLFFGIRSRYSQVIGAVIGFAGAGLLLYFSEASTDSSYIFYTAIMVLASAAYATSSLIVKAKLNHLPSMNISTGVYTIWMLPSLIILGFSGFFNDINFQTSTTWTALGYLSILTFIGTTLAMALFYKLIQDTSAVFASSVSFLIPIVAVLWGVLDGEKFIIWYGIGGFLILIGIYLIREKKTKITLNSTVLKLPNTNQK